MQVVRANMDSPTVAAATEGGSPFYKIYEIYLVRCAKLQTVDTLTILGSWRWEDEEESGVRESPLCTEQA